MRAWVLGGVGQLTWEEVPTPIPKAGEALVSVRAAGICGSDIPRIYKTGAHQHPLIPGHEFSGKVTQVGDRADRGWIGRRVGIFPLIPCRGCTPCARGQYELCRHYDYMGSRRNGGFAEYVAVPVWNLLPLPDQVGYEEAAMLEPMAVAVHAVRRAIGMAGSRKIETAAVCGLGTIGLLLLLFLRDLGIRQIFVMGNKAFQKDQALSFGVKDRDFCDVRRRDPQAWLMDRTEGRGAELFFECAGKNETCALAVAGAAPGGTVVLVGNPSSDMLIKKEVYGKILRNQLKVTGTWNSSFCHSPEDDWSFALDSLVRGTIIPAGIISHRYSLEDMSRGLELMRDKTEDYGKVMGIRSKTH